MMSQKDRKIDPVGDKFEALVIDSFDVLEQRVGKIEMLLMRTSIEQFKRLDKDLLELVPRCVPLLSSSSLQPEPDQSPEIPKPDMEIEIIGSTIMPTIPEFPDLRLLQPSNINGDKVFESGLPPGLQGTEHTNTEDENCSSYLLPSCDECCEQASQEQGSASALSHSEMLQRILDRLNSSKLLNRSDL